MPRPWAVPCARAPPSYFSPSESFLVPEILSASLPTVPLTRREALARERCAVRASPPGPPRRRTFQALEPAVLQAGPRTTTAPRLPIARTGFSDRQQLPLHFPVVPSSSRKTRALGPLLGALAVTMFFTANTTPATASDLAGGATPTNVVAPISGQSLTASVVAVSLDNRDGYAVTERVVAAPQTVTAEQPGTGSPATTGTADIRWPFPGVTPLSSDFGPRARPCGACSAMHEGIDMIPGANTPIGSIAAGTVRVSGIGGAYGQYAIIDHQINGQRISSLYAHMVLGSSPLRVGDTVGAGDLVGLVGSSGVSTGAHLHLSILLDGTYQIDPQLWLEANANRVS